MQKQGSEISVQGEINDWKKLRGDRLSVVSRSARK